MRLSHRHQLQSIHAVPGARKPVIRFMLNGKRVEISLNNSAAIVNSRFVEMMTKDHIFLHFLKFTRFTFAKMELARPGRFSSYSLTIAIIAFLTGKGVVKPLEEMISNEPKTDLKDEFCKKDWDYRLPATPPEIKWNCCSKQEAISTILSNFVEFSAWLASIEGILDTRSGKILSEENFLAKYEMSKEIFKLGGGLNIVDPFEIEHNTTNQITERSKFQIQKILKGVSIKAKMKRLVGKSSLCV